MSAARRRAREFALQGLYQWQLTKASPEEINAHLNSIADFNETNREFFELLFNGTLTRANELRTLLTPYLDRPYEELSPIECAVLLLGAYELSHCPRTPVKVVLNEAVELTKIYGATDGHKFINGVLDKLAKRLSENLSSSSTE